MAVAGCLDSVLAVVGGELEPSARGHAGAGSFSDTVVTIAGDKDKVEFLLYKYFFLYISTTDPRWE